MIRERRFAQLGRCSNGRIAMPWPNGLYHATTMDFDVPYSLVLRLDLNPRGGPGSWVSLDLYRGFVSATDPDLAPTPVSVVYLGTFRSDELLPREPGPPELDVTLHLVSDGSPTIRLRLQADTTPSRADYRISYTATDVQPLFPAGSLNFFAKYQAPSFHELVLNV